MSDQWTPDWIIRPGEFLAEVMTEGNLSIDQVATVCELEPTIIRGILTGQQPISSTEAAGLARMGVSEQFWLNAERHYREGLAAGKKELDALPVAGTQHGFRTPPVDSAGPDSLWTPLEVSEYLRVPVGTLAQWRARGVGPNAIRVGRHVRYRGPDVESWISEQADKYGVRPWRSSRPQGTE
jgi:plasmid maintenance system antidote protein VapI